MQTSFDHFQKLIHDYTHVGDVLIVGGGPSLKKFDLSRIQPSSECLVICCNQAIFQIPQAQIAHHADYRWWQDYADALKQLDLPLISGCGLGTNQPYPPQQVCKLSSINHRNHSQLFVNSELVYGNNTGLQALSMAHLFQPERIWLMGFDFQAIDQHSHGYEKLTLESLQHYEKFWGYFLKDFARFEKLKKQQWPHAFPHQKPPNIFNLNPQSALKRYPTVEQWPEFLY